MGNELTTQTAQNTALDSYDDLVADAGRGTENIGANDVRPPRLMLCQAGSPQRKPDNPKQIAGLQELDLFNSLSGEIYGRSIRVVVIDQLGSHHVEFGNDMTVVDFDVPEGDPRTEWTEDAEGNRVKPIATKFYDYLLWLPDNSEVVAFSFKSTQIKNAIKLNGLLKLPLKMGDKIILNPPAWARTYKLETKMESDSGLNWGGYNLATDGVTPTDMRLMISAMAKGYKGKKIEIDRTDEVTERQSTATGDGDPEDM